MKPAPFEYFAPTMVEGALDYLVQFGYEAKVLAGGQSLLPIMNFRLAQPSVLIDLNRIPGLAFIRPDGDGGLRLGAMTRQNQLEHSNLVAERAPLLHQAMPRIAYPQIRTRGTFGGSVAHADPAAELPAVSVALNGRFRLRGLSGERWVSAEEFFIGLFYTALEPDELLTEIAIPPMPSRSGWSIQEVSRRHHDFAMAGVAVFLTLDEEGMCEDVRMVFFSVGDGPMFAHHVADTLKGQPLNPESIREAAELASTADIDPGSDIHASADYRRHLTSVLARRTLEEAHVRAKRQG